MRGIAAALRVKVQVALQERYQALEDAAREHLAPDLEVVPTQTGMHTIAYSDGHMQVMSASLLGPGDCVVVISNSGRTRDLMDACDIARKNGATTIVITASGSPLAAAGHIHLSADHPEGFDRYSPMVSRLLHLLIIDVLVTCVALRIGGGKLQPRLQEMKNNLRNKRYA